MVFFFLSIKDILTKGCTHRERHSVIGKAALNSALMFPTKHLKVPSFFMLSFRKCLTLRTKIPIK